MAFPTLPFLTRNKLRDVFLQQPPVFSISRLLHPSNSLEDLFSFFLSWNRWFILGAEKIRKRARCSTIYKTVYSRLHSMAAAVVQVDPRSKNSRNSHHAGRCGRLRRRFRGLDCWAITSRSRRTQSYPPGPDRTCGPIILYFGNSFWVVFYFLDKKGPHGFRVTP